MSRKGKPERSGSLASLADVLPGLCADLALERKVNEMAVLALWPQQVATLAGQTMATQTRALRLRKQGERTVLMVKVAHAALSSELGFHLPMLKDALNRYTPQTGITIDQIRMQVGAL